MKKIIIAVVLLAAVITGIIILASRITAPKKSISKTPPIVIGFSLGATHEERWLASDLPLFIKRAEELGASVNYLSSNYDADAQISQIENLISQGIKTIVVMPADSEKIAPVIVEANRAGVKIIAYDRLIKNCNLDYYVSFDNFKVGVLEAQSIVDVVNKGNFAYIGGAPTDNNAFLVKDGSMSVLEPKIKNGNIKLVVDKFSNNWDPVEAQKNLKAYLDTGAHLDAVVAANDGTAFGSILALQEKKLDGKIPVSGQDAELSACQRIVAGTQTSTVYKPIKLLAAQAAEMAVALARGETPQTNNNVNNGQVNVPSFLLDPVLVTKDNMQDTVVKDGFHTYNEIYNHKTESDNQSLINQVNAQP
jgi:D-xylose transport system substrate-binding protein